MNLKGARYPSISVLYNGSCSMLLIGAATRERGINMRTFAFFGAATIAASLFAAGSALAWTTEQPAQQDQNSVLFSDADKFKALEDKVNGKSQSQSGFYFSGGINGGDSGTTGANPYNRLQPMTGSSSAFSYSPMPGFRGQPQ
jgi:hypothetical protein